MTPIPRRAGRALLALAAALLTLVALPTPHAEAATAHGCPSGYVCVYPNGSWNSDRPSLKFYTYGAHNLSGQYNTHRVFNNQTGGAVVALCTAYDGGGCGTWHKPGWYDDVNLTPINSITLAATPPGGGGSGSGVGGTITKAEILTRLRDWYNRRLPYDTNGSAWDLGSTRRYRTDCSGLADMALHLASDLNTTGFTQSSLFTRRLDVTDSNRSWLTSAHVQTGDVFDDTIDGHAFVFASWNSDGTFNYYNFGGGTSGVAPPEYHTSAHVGDGYWGGEQASNYVIYRYSKVV